MRQVLLLTAALAAIPLAAAAQNDAAPAAPTTPEEFHHARETRMGEGRRTLGALKQAADSGGDLAALTPRIESLIAWSDELPALFPEGSAAGHVRPEIWSNPAGFAAAAQRFQSATRALAAPAAAGDRPAFLTAWTAVRASCGGCHEGYKAD
ncbi:MAG TPA: cytochrome c [Allosphingosinicella sp.]|nr:cytochrome c [Allosphingosinicella sp.]